jgi:hypothetical protein
MKPLPGLLVFVALFAALAAVLATTALLVLPAAYSAEAPPGPAAVPAEAWSWGPGRGAAAVGALAEKPELFGRLLILVGLAEGIAIYGLIVSILILNRLL